MQPRGILLLLFLLAGALAACAADQPAGPTESPAPTSTKVNTATAAPSDTPPPTTAPPTRTPTATASPGPDFAQANLISVAHLQDKRIMVVLEVPGGVEGIFDGYLGSNYLPCSTPYQYPNRIICVGPEPFINYSPQGTRFHLYPTYRETAEPPLFEAFVSIPAQATPTATQPVWYPPAPDPGSTLLP